MCAFVLERGYDIRFAIEPKPNEPRGHMLLPTVGHGLAFIERLEHPEMVGLNPEFAHETMSGLNFHHGVAQALWAGKLFHIDLNAQVAGKFDQDFRFGSEGLKDAFFLVRLLESSGWDGMRHFDAHPYRTEGPEGVWDFAVGLHADLPHAGRAGGPVRRRPGGAGGAGGGPGGRPLRADFGGRHRGVAGPRRRPRRGRAGSGALRARAARPADRGAHPGRAVAAVLVAGVDSSTQSCKVVVCDVDDGTVVAAGAAPHPSVSPPRSEQDPEAWWAAFESAWAAAGSPEVAALSVAGQQHGMVALDAGGVPVHPAKLWNDVESAPQAAELVAALGAPAWAAACGSVPTASFTITKLAWLRATRPEAWSRVAQVLLPHDWLTWRLTGRAVTDRGDASGTGWWSPAEGRVRPDLLALVGFDGELPAVLAPDEVAGERCPSPHAAWWRAGRATTWPPRSGWRWRRATSPCRWGRAGPCSRCRPRRPRTPPVWSPASPTPPAGSCPSSAP